MGSQRLRGKHRAFMGLCQVLYIYAMAVSLVVLWGLLTVGAGMSLNLLPALGLLGCLV